MIPFADQTHDHQSCIQSGIKAVRDVCQEKGIKLTPLRLQVMEILLSEHRAFGAYEVLELLQKKGKGNAPTMAYRALNFLEVNGFAHRIERRNAYIACSMPGVPHNAQFLICRNCGTVAEWVTDVNFAELGAVAKEIGFVVDHLLVEAEGFCQACQKQDEV